MRLVRPLVPLLLLLLAGCGARPGGPAPAAPPADPLRGETFLSDQVTVDGKPHELVAGTEVSLNFTRDGRLVATAGCNTMSGPVRTGDGRLEVGGDGLATTDLGCDPPRHAQDAWLGKVLGAGPDWRLDGPRLTVHTADTELVLTDREVADPDLSLAETPWSVDTLVDGSAASSVPAGAAATLVFHDERVDISAGCNTGTAGYSMTGDTIRFGTATMTRKACPPGIMRLEAAVLGVVDGVVDGAVTFEIDADRLTLNHSSGKGLQLRAQ
jgi:heat shock protein HslJ